MYAKQLYKYKDKDRYIIETFSCNNFTLSSSEMAERNIILTNSNRDYNNKTLIVPSVNKIEIVDNLGILIDKYLVLNKPIKIGENYIIEGNILFTDLHCCKNIYTLDEYEKKLSKLGLSLQTVPKLDIILSDHPISIIDTPLDELTTEELIHRLRSIKYYYYEYYDYRILSFKDFSLLSGFNTIFNILKQKFGFEQKEIINIITSYDNDYIDYGFDNLVGKQYYMDKTSTVKFKLNEYNFFKSLYYFHGWELSYTAKKYIDFEPLYNKLNTYIYKEENSLSSWILLNACEICSNKEDMLNEIYNEILKDGYKVNDEIVDNKDIYEQALKVLKHYCTSKKLVQTIETESNKYIEEVENEELNNKHLI